MAVAPAVASELVLADRGQTAYRIVVADGASPSTKHGAEELQRFLEQMSGAKLPIVSDREPLVATEIIVGDNAHLKQLNAPLVLASLGGEGYVIRTAGQRLIIAGGAQRGNLYGVYGFLEDHLGCRWFTPDVSRIPKRTRLTIGPINDRQTPVFEYREPYVDDCRDPDWCARNRMNSSNSELDARHGGRVRFADGFFVHTFDRLVPSGKYFAQHPEYFSMILGRRKKDRSQLCCTNRDVIRLCTEGVLQAMREQPGATVFSVSQNDCYNSCQCPACRDLSQREGSEMAPVLQLVNQVAEAAEKQFPKKIIETLAYQWTRHPPKTIRPRRNVIVRLCSIECCFSHPLATCDSKQNREFRADLDAWARVAPRLWVWDYTTDFSQYLLPFPNLRARSENARFFAEHRVKGLFEQDTYNTPEGEFSELGGYVSAKCLWNPNCDANVAIREFLAAYYGPAAEPIATYINLLHEYAERQNIHVGCYADTNSSHLSNALLAAADPLWQQAESRVIGNRVLSRRVRMARLSVDFAILERARLQSQRKLPVDPKFRNLAAARFRPFCDAFQTSRVTHLLESDSLNKQAYCKQLAKDLRLAL